MGMLDDDEVRRRLEYRPPTDETRPAYEMSRALVRLLFEVWNGALPPGREAALALTALEEAHSWANAAVARNAGPEWTLPTVDVSTQLDEVLEHLEGPLHLRSRSVGGGGPVDEGSGGDIGPEGAEMGPNGPDSAVVGVEPAGSELATARDAVTLDALEGPVHRR